eukprot:GHVR01106995.1.p1 GENE.GHVR01106995.1~~GHVR01106995.1.p1  ORF type:complete len:198 (-),score=81.79 GHVR01106995.1:66-659(-)
MTHSLMFSHYLHSLLFTHQTHTHTHTHTYYSYEQWSLMCNVLDGVCVCVLTSVPLKSDEFQMGQGSVHAGTSLQGGGGGTDGGGGDSIGLQPLGVADLVERITVTWLPVVKLNEVVLQTNSNLVTSSTQLPFIQGSAASPPPYKVLRYNNNNNEETVGKMDVETVDMSSVGVRVDVKLPSVRLGKYGWKIIFRGVPN